MSTQANHEKAALNHLTAWMRDEVQSQGERVETLRKLRESMAKKDPKHCEIVLETVQAQQERSHVSEKRRQTIFKALGMQWEVSPKVLTLRSIAERAGDDGLRIMELRSELQEKVEQVGVEGKMVNATARMHRTVILEVLNTLFDQKVGDPLEEQGRLFNAEA